MIDKNQDENFDIVFTESLVFFNGNKVQNPKEQPDVKLNK